MSPKNLVLGIDLGTTSVKIVILSSESKQIIAKGSEDTHACVASVLGTRGSEQDVPKILSAINRCVSKLPRDLLKQVRKIGICGQMHGVTLWKTLKTVKRNEGVLKLEIDEAYVSNLYTWQDGRCDENFLASLPATRSHLPIHKGYGCATLFWFASNKSEILQKYDKCGTIQDFIVSLLCGNDEVVMSNQNAASWGYFLSDKAEWEIDTMTAAYFPVHLLPKKIVQPGGIAGNLSQMWFGIPAGVSIGAALGDLQCSAYALLETENDAALNISTSAQMAYVHPTFKPGDKSQQNSIEYFPYFDNKYLAVAASLNGGNALATFVKTLQQWTEELGFSVAQSQIWEKCIKLGGDDSGINTMEIEPLCLGERHNPEKTASVTGITMETLHLGTVFRSLCSGIIRNLHSMMSDDLLKKEGIERIIGNGSSLTRNSVLQKEVVQWYKLPLVLNHFSDAALGAALFVMINQRL